MLVRMWNSRNSRSLMAGIQNGAATLEDSFVVSYTIKLQYLATWCKQLSHWKRPWCWERLKAEREEGNRRWDGWIAPPINGHELGQTLRDGEGQRGLARSSPRGCKELDMTWWLDNNYKTTEHSLTSWPSNHTPLYLHKGVENLHPHKNAHTYVYSSFIFITWKNEKKKRKMQINNY